MLPDMLNDVYFLQEKAKPQVGYLLASSVFVFKKQSALLQLTANSISFPCITGALETRCNL